MNALLTVYRKEMRSYLVGPIAYVTAMILACFSAVWVFFVDDFWNRQQARVDSLFALMPWVFILVAPAITMRLWAEEVRGGTVETLLTMPAKSWSLVGGKFLSALTLLFLCLLCTLPIVFTVASFGDLDWGPVLGGYLGSLLMGGAILAFGLWISALTGHQIVAFLITAIVALILVLVGLLSHRTGGAGAVFEHVSTWSRFQSLGRGVLDFRDVLYFGSFLFFFLYLTTRAVESWRYR
jgi:ABC-2 type transport system permease protein